MYGGLDLGLDLMLAIAATVPYLGTVTSMLAASSEAPVTESVQLQVGRWEIGDGLVGDRYVPRLTRYAWKVPMFTPP